MVARDEDPLSPGLWVGFISLVALISMFAKQDDIVPLQNWCCPILPVVVGFAPVYGRFALQFPINAWQSVGSLPVFCYLFFCAAVEALVL